MEAMTRGEFWILDVVVEGKYPLSALEPDDIEALEMSFNRAWHGLSHNALVELLTQLFASGDLSGEGIRMKCLPKSRRIDEDLGSLTPSRADIEAALTLSFQSDDDWAGTIYYGLTSQGGARWESVARPDWHRFVDHYGYRDGQGIDWLEIKAVDRSLVERYFACALVDGSAVPGTEAWEELTPWEATYWKVLPHGWGVRYHECPSRDPRLSVPAWAIPVAATLGPDHRGGYPLPVWYTNPWDPPQRPYLW